MKFLVGKKADFIDFLNSINKKDKIGFLSHNDLDGIGSSILLEEILQDKQLNNIKMKIFLDYKKNIFSEVYQLLKKEKISTLFISDLNPENIDADGFERLRKEFKVFSVDHHPLGQLKDTKNIIKSESTQCTTFVYYQLGREVIDIKKWKWLVYAASISDFSYKNPNILKFIQESYPEVTMENIHDSKIGKISSIISSSLIYFVDNIKKVYELIKKQNLNKLEKYDIKIREEIAKWVKKYQEEAEYFPERNLYFYYYTPKFNITGVVTEILSNKKPDTTFVSVSDIQNDNNKVKVSARNQNSKEDMIQLIKKGMQGLENAVGGGHVPAAGGSFMKEDIKRFKKNIIEHR